MKQQLNWESNDMDTQISNSRSMWRSSGKNTRTKAGKFTQHLKIICLQSTGQLSSVSTSAQTLEIISETTRALERRWEHRVIQCTWTILNSCTYGYQRSSIRDPKWFSNIMNSFLYNIVSDSYWRPSQDCWVIYHKMSTVWPGQDGAGIYYYTEL